MVDSVAWEQGILMGPTGDVLIGRAGDYSSYISAPQSGRGVPNGTRSGWGQGAM